MVDAELERKLSLYAPWKLRHLVCSRVMSSLCVAVDVGPRGSGQAEPRRRLVLVDSSEAAARAEHALREVRPACADRLSSMRA